MNKDDFYKCLKTNKTLFLAYNGEKEKNVFPGTFGIYEEKRGRYSFYCVDEHCVCEVVAKSERKGELYELILKEFGLSFDKTEKAPINTHLRPTLGRPTNRPRYLALCRIALPKMKASRKNQTPAMRFRMKKKNN